MRHATLRFLLGRLGCYLGAVLVGYALASALATQHVVRQLGEMGLTVGWQDRLAMTTHDLAGMANLFLPMVAFALLVAFMAAALLNRWLHRWRAALYAMAGGLAVVTIHQTMHLAFGITPIAAARSTGGLLLQGLAGGLAGLAYLWLIRRQGAVWRELQPT